VVLRINKIIVDCFFTNLEMRNDEKYYFIKIKIKCEIAS